MCFLLVRESEDSVLRISLRRKRSSPLDEILIRITEIDRLDRPAGSGTHHGSLNDLYMVPPEMLQSKFK